MNDWIDAIKSADAWMLTDVTSHLTLIKREYNLVMDVYKSKISTVEAAAVQAPFSGRLSYIEPRQRHGQTQIFVKEVVKSLNQ